MEKKNKGFAFCAMLFVLFLCSTANTQAQPVIVTKGDRAAADSSRVRLQSGVLLVRLNTRPIGYKALLKNGEVARAQALSKKVNAQNRIIAAAFKKNFNYSKVYFFADTLTEQVKSRDFSHVTWLDTMLQADASVHLNPQTFFLVAEFGSLNQSEMPVEGLKVLNASFEMMQPPFPYFIRTYNGLFTFMKRKSDQAVKALNERLSGKPQPK